MNTVNLKTLSDSELHLRTRKVVGHEMDYTLLVLDHLREIERRRLYAKWGHSSLHQYCVQELGYCGGTAQARIDAMRLSKDIPEIRDALKNGEVTLGNVVTFQKFLRHEEKYGTSLQEQANEDKPNGNKPNGNKSNRNKPKMCKPTGKTYTPVEKKKLLKEIGRKSRFEAEKLLAGKSTQGDFGLSKYNDKARPITLEKTEIRFLADEKLMGQIERMKELLANGKLNPGFSDVFGKAMEIALQKIDPKLKKTSKDEKIPKRSESISAAEMKSNASNADRKDSVSAAEMKSNATNAEMNLKNSKTTDLRSHSKKRPYISVFLVRKLLKKANYQCMFISPNTKRRCTEKRGLEIEHTVPIAKDGSSKEWNLEIFCKSHNLHRAIEEFGQEKMKPYLRI